jgi:uncharacterized protein (TIGR03435 family)
MSELLSWITFEAASFELSLVIEATLVLGLVLLAVRLLWRARAVLDRRQPRGRLGPVGVTATALAALLLAGTPAPLRAVGSPQDRPDLDRRLAFDVASVKRNVTSEQTAAPIRPEWGSGRLTVTGASLTQLVRFAYELQPHQSIEGEPAWKDERFDIVAVAPGPLPRPVDTRGFLERWARPAPAGDFAPMLRTLLAERFKLAARWEARQQPAYALVVAAADGSLHPNLRRSDADCDAIAAQREQIVSTSPDELRERLEASRRGEVPAPPCSMGWTPLLEGGAAQVRADSRSLSELIPLLQAQVEHPVMDRTGLTGLFSYELLFARAPAAPAGPREPGDVVPARPSLFEALEQQLGLRLELRHEPVDVLVIDHVELPEPD